MGDCGFCGETDHSTSNHECKSCGVLGLHRTGFCPQVKGKLLCGLCGSEEHFTENHKCKKCKLSGLHRSSLCKKRKSGKKKTTPINVPGKIKLSTSEKHIRRNSEPDVPTKSSSQRGGKNRNSDKLYTPPGSIEPTYTASIILKDIDKFLASSPRHSRTSVLPSGSRLEEFEPEYTTKEFIMVAGTESSSESENCVVLLPNIEPESSKIITRLEPTRIPLPADYLCNQFKNTCEKVNEYCTLTVKISMLDNQLYPEVSNIIPIKATEILSGNKNYCRGLINIVNDHPIEYISNSNRHDVGLILLIDDLQAGTNGTMSIEGDIYRQTDVYYYIQYARNYLMANSCIIKGVKIIKDVKYVPIIPINIGVASVSTQTDTNLKPLLFEALQKMKCRTLVIPDYYPNKQFIVSLKDLLYNHDLRHNFDQIIFPVQDASRSFMYRDFFCIIYLKI